MMGWKGVYVPVITPFTEDDKICASSVDAHIEWVLSCGVDGIVIGGSTGENTLLSFAEKKELYEIAVKAVARRVPLIAGSTSDSTDETIEMAQMAQACGVDGLLVMPPTYSKINMKQAYEHICLVADAVEIPIMVYNNPSRSMIDLSVECIAELAKIENICSVKESTGDVSRIHKICRSVPADFTVLSGNDTMVLEMLASGATGWVATSANVLPRECTEMTNLMNNGDLPAARRLYYKILPALEAIEDSGHAFQCVKYVLSQTRDYPVGHSRRPLSLYELPDDVKKELLELVSAK